MNKYSFAVLLGLCLLLVPQSVTANQIDSDSIPPITNNQIEKMEGSSKVSGILIAQIRSEKNYFARGPKALKGTYLENSTSRDIINHEVVVYVSNRFSSEEIDRLRDSGVLINQSDFYEDSGGHGIKGSIGHYTLTIPVDELIQISKMSKVRLITTAEGPGGILLDESTKEIGTNLFNNVNVKSGNLNGDNVRIAIIDTGIDTSHKALQNLVVNSEDYVGDGSVADEHGHGTHIAGIIASKNKTFSGVAPGVELIILDVGDNRAGQINPSDVEDAIYDAVDQYNADVISLSLGYQYGQFSHRDGTDFLSNAVDYAVDEGANFIVSAGNEANENNHLHATIPANTAMNYTLNTGRGRADFYLVTQGKNADMRLYRNGNQTSFQTYNDPWIEDKKGYWHDYARKDSFGTGYNYNISIVNEENSPIVIDLYTTGNANLGSDDATIDRTITAPACAEKGIAVGSYVTKGRWTDSKGRNWPPNHPIPEDVISDFSSRGSTIDGRVKPDMVAPGR